MLDIDPMKVITLIQKRPSVFKRVQRGCLEDANFVYSTPPQTNGNRLRRWLKNQPLDQNKINLEFQHTCLLGVQLIKNKQEQWRILRFGMHAG